MSHKILHIDSSPRGGESVSKKLSAQLVERLKSKQSDTQVNHRDVSTGLPVVGPLTLAGYWSDPAEHSPEVKAAVEMSDTLIKEVLEADTIVLGIPVWNFLVPSTLKAWVDLVVRSNFTFKMGEAGYEGMVPTGKKAYLVVASGGLPIGSEMEMGSKYMQTVLSFIGITDTTIIGAGSLQTPNAEESLKSAEAQIAAL